MSQELLHITRTPLSHIELEDLTYSMLPAEIEADTEKIQSQIAKTGILHPPVLIENKNGNYSIVCGKNRIRSAKAMGFSSVDCYCLPKESDEIEVYTIALSESIFQHEISPLEKAIFFEKLSKIFSLELVASHFLPIIGLPPRPKFVKKLVSLAALEHPIAQALHNYEVDEKAAQLLVELSFRDRLIIFEVISALQLSVSNQRKLIQYCKDLSLRKNCSILEILSSDDVQNIITHADSNPPQKAANLMKYIERTVSPQLADAENQFSKLKHSLSLPKWATLNHSHAFEKDELTLSLKFPSSAPLVRFCKNYLQN